MNIKNINNNINSNLSLSNNNNNNNHNNFIKNRKRTNDIEINENITFSELLLQDEILKGLEDAGYIKPSPIQLKAIPLGISGIDIIAQAKSGTGKTVVFGVIALECVLRQVKLFKENQNSITKPTNKELLDMDDESYSELIGGVPRKPLVLIMAPTREIAVQIGDVIKQISKYCKRIKTQVFIGGLKEDNDIGRLAGSQIIVGTPGRIKSLIENLQLRTDTLKMLILDEADKLLDASFTKTINWIYTTMPSARQILAFSATYPTYLINILSTYMNSPIQIRLCSDTPSLDGIKQYYQVFNNPDSLKPSSNYKLFQEKIKSLLLVLEQVSFYQAIIFINNKSRAEELTRTLNRESWPTLFIAGGQDQRERLQTMNALKQFNIRIVVSTDIFSRGIDVERVNLVINMDLPKDHETYFHRIGRAGRFGTFGISLTFICDNSNGNNSNNNNDNSSNRRISSSSSSSSDRGSSNNDIKELVEDIENVKEIDFIKELIENYKVEIFQRVDNDLIPDEFYKYELSNPNDIESLNKLKLQQEQQQILNKINHQVKEISDSSNSNINSNRIKNNNSSHIKAIVNNFENNYEYFEDDYVNEAVNSLKSNYINSNRANNKNVNHSNSFENNNFNSNIKKKLNGINNNNIGHFNSNNFEYLNISNNNQFGNNNYHQYYEQNYSNQNYYNNHQNNNRIRISAYTPFRPSQETLVSSSPLSFYNSNPYGFDNIPTPAQYTSNQFYRCGCPQCPNKIHQY